MALVEYVNKDLPKSPTTWQAEGFGDVNPAWTRVNPKADPVVAVPPQSPEDGKSK